MGDTDNSIIDTSFATQGRRCWFDANRSCADIMDVVRRPEHDSMRGDEFYELICSVHHERTCSTVWERSASRVLLESIMNTNSFPPPRRFKSPHADVTTPLSRRCVETFGLKNTMFSNRNRCELSPRRPPPTRELSTIWFERTDKHAAVRRCSSDNR